MKTMKLTTALLLTIIAAPMALLGQTSLPPGSYERFLLPITAIRAPGAFGTSWTTEVWLPPGANVFPSFAPSACDPPCPDGGGPPTGASYQIGFFRTHGNETPGSLLYVLQQNAEHVDVSLRLTETSGASHLLPLQLPVVRERQFTNDTVHVVGIPLGARTRATARIYGIDPDQLGNVEVRACREDTPGQSLILDETVPLAVAQLTYVAGPYRAEMRPPVTQISLDGLRATGATLVRLEITPLIPALRIWAFVSITDNDTQAITLRTP